MLRNKIIQTLGTFALCLPLAVATSALAKDKKSKGKAKSNESGDDNYQPPYGMAGCGLGSLVIHKDDMMPQVTAVTLNGTGFQTSALSCTGSSNCQITKAELAQAEQEVFVAANLRNLEEDVTRGGGGYTRAFAQVLGCAEGDDYSEFLEVSRANYSDIFSSNDPKVVYTHYLGVLRASPRLANGCERVMFKT
jgi:hypothetical protein